MALANGQAVQADEAQSISDLTDASKSAGSPLKQFQQLSVGGYSELASESVQALQPANIMPSQPG